MDRRSYRRRKKRNKKIKRFRIYFLIAILFTTSVFILKFIDKDKSKNQVAAMENLSKEEIKEINNLVDPKVENKDLGDTESIIEYGDKGLIGAHYPVFGKKILTQLIKK